MNHKQFYFLLYPILSIFLLAALGYSAQSVQAGSTAGAIVVNSTQDTINNDGYCTLREAIIAANKDKSSGRLAGECSASQGSDTIILPAGTYTLTRTDSGNEDSSSTGDLDITGDLTIQGAGAATTVIQALDFSDRVIQVISGKVVISGVTIEGGNVTGNGGGIENDSSLVLADSVINSSQASGQGGGIFNAAASMLDVTGSTIDGNQAAGNGGGIANLGSLTAVNSTIANNTSASSGGGIYNLNSLALNNLTIAANQAAHGGGASNDPAGVFNFENSILAGNNAADSPDCSGSLTFQGYNLVQDLSGCTISGDATGDLNDVDPLLGQLQDNGGSTPTMALKSGSPAIDAGNPGTPGSGSGTCQTTDQRGVSRPQALACDIGAFELENPAQTGPIYTVNASDDQSDGVCGILHCNLREALEAANQHSHGTNPDEIHFALPGSAPFVIYPLSALPVVSDPVIIDGTTQTGGQVEINGSQAGAGVDGLSISAGGSTLQGLVIDQFTGSGVVLSGQGNNLLQNNTINGNGGNGVVVQSGNGDSILSNSIFDNTGLGIDLGADGVTPNDAGDVDAGPNNLQNFPVLNQVVSDPEVGNINVEGRLNSTANTTFSLQFFSNQACSPSGYGEGRTYLGSSDPVTTDEHGNVYFQTTINANLGQGSIVTAIATGLDESSSEYESSSEFSPCTIVGEGNVSWPRALSLSSTSGLPNTLNATANEYIDQQGQSRWFKFSVQPGSKVIVTLTNLAANFDLTLYKDIPAAYKTLTSPQDLVRLNAEFAPDAFSPDAFSPDAFSPDAFSPDAFSPDAFSPDAFSPDAFSPDAFSPDAFSPDAFSPDAFSPDAFSPDAFSPDAFSPDAFSPDAFSPDAFSPDAFSSAQTRSLIAVSAFNGTVSEGILVNTWDNNGDFYVRVRGRNGAFSLEKPFHLGVTLLTGECSSVTSDLSATSLTADSGNFHTLILTNPDRMPGSESDKATMLQQLDAFAARPEVAGEVIDVSADARVVAAYQQADTYPACPYAENLVAQAIKSIVDRYRADNPIEYVVIVGNDNTIPFFRYPDQALLASEKNYVPPVLDDSPSQASLKLGYVLGQDEYGSSQEISSKESNFPIPDLAVGRLVETAGEVTGMLNAYLGTDGGKLPPPSSLLVTGYDFLSDAAVAVQNELQAGSGVQADTLITPRDVSPADPSAWTSDQLRAKLLGSRHDLIFLAGHFSANTALAADYTTRMFSTDVVSSTVDLTNAIIFSAGCHSGYNIVDSAAVPRVTLQPDWAEAFASKQATLIAGTGYQYGDTDFIKYSERIYLNFSKQLLAGTGPVPIGKALVAAKQSYLAETPALRGIDEKSLLEATLYGLPMLSVNMPDGRSNAGPQPSIVSSVQSFTSDPGATLGLSYADIDVATPLVENTVVLTNTTGTGTVTATYLSGENGVVSSPAEPVLPLSLKNVSVANTVLRGVGFRGGAYTDTPDILPLTGAATTEIRGVHPPFLSSVLFPVQPWQTNYFAALSDPAAGATRLSLTPAQYISQTPGSSLTTLRSFSDMQFRLYYSANTSTYAGGSVPGLAAAPTISLVSATANGDQVAFQVKVVGDPSAGIQEVWVTYTAISGPLKGQWQSLDLAQSSADSTLWENSLPLNGVSAEDIRFIVQAVNGVGLVSLDANLGAYYVPGINQEPTQPTSLALTIPPDPAPYGSSATFSALLTSNGASLAGQLINFTLGPQSRQALTDASGQVTVSLKLLGLPGSNEVRASFAGLGDYQASSASAAFSITRQETVITLQPQPDYSQYSDPQTSQYSDPPALEAVLTDVLGQRLSQQTVFFVLDGPGGSFAYPVITDYAGRAQLSALLLKPGEYSVAIYFSGTIPLPDKTLNLSDERYEPSSTTGSLDILPCDKAYPSIMYIWPPNNDLVSVNVLGINDPDGDPVTITITAIYQDEPVGTDSASPDGFGVGTSTAKVRSERDGTGDGRVYHIYFTASDGKGGTCDGEVRVGVSDNQGEGLDPIDGGPLYDSTIPG